MTPSEVAEIIANLREAADTLAFVRADLDELEVVASSIISDNGKCKLRITKGVLSAEIALREALEPIEV